jgi:hypothetical protein
LFSKLLFARRWLKWIEVRLRFGAGASGTQMTPHDFEKGISSFLGASMNTLVLWSLRELENLHFMPLQLKCAQSQLLVISMCSGAKQNPQVRLLEF